MTVLRSILRRCATAGVALFWALALANSGATAQEQAPWLKGQIFYADPGAHVIVVNDIEYVYSSQTTIYDANEIPVPPRALAVGQYVRIVPLHSGRRAHGRMQAKEIHILQDQGTPERR